MLKKLNQKTIFTISTCLISTLFALAFEFIVNRVFPQPSFFFSFDRFVSITIFIISTTFLIKYHKYFYEHLHKAFLLISLAFGVSFILVFPKTLYLSPDDQIHFKNAYFFMNESMEIKGGFSAIGSSTFTSVDSKGFDEISKVYANMNEANNVVIDEKHTISVSRQLYNTIVYLPFHLGLRLADLLHLKFTSGIVIAKIFNLVCYVILVYFAIKSSGKFNRIFFVIGLLTSNMFLATQFSYDPLVIASLLLAISLFLHIKQTKNISAKYLLGFILAATFGSLTKAVYCPILLLALMIPNDNFDCKKRAIAFKICAIFVMLVLASTFVLPILSGGLASDIRGGDTSVSGQIGFLLNNPLKAIAIILLFIFNQLPNLVFEPTSSFVSLGMTASSGLIYDLCSPVVPMVGVLSFLVLLWATFGTVLDKKTIITKRTKLGIAIIYLILVGSTTASMYLSFTAVGGMRVDGMQPRYLMPFLPLLLILFIPTSKPQRTASSQIIVFVPYICLTLIIATYILRMSML